MNLHDRLTIGDSAWPIPRPYSEGQGERLAVPANLQSVFKAVHRSRSFPVDELTGKRAAPRAVVRPPPPRCSRPFNAVRIQLKGKKVKRRILHTGWHRHYEGQAQQDLVKYFCYHPGPNLDTLQWMFKRRIRWWGMDAGSCDHSMNTSIRYMRPDLAEEFAKRHGKTPGEFFGTFHYKHKRSGREASADVFPFHTWAFQEGLLHAENIGGDIELMLNKRCMIGAFPWRYEGLESCPCRILCFDDVGDSVEAIGDAAKAILRNH